MLAHLTLIEEGLYEYQTARGPRFLVRLKHGKKEIRKAGLPNRTLARKYLDKIRGHVVERKFFPERLKAPMLKDYGKQFLSGCRVRDLKANTLRSYEQNLTDHVYPMLGEFRLTDIRRQHIKALLTNKRADGLSPNSVRLILAPLSALMSDALDEELIDANPCFRPGKILKLRKRTRDIMPFTEEEEGKLLKAIREHEPDYEAFILTMRLAGLRIGEASALLVTDVDFGRGLLSVSKNFTNGRLEDSPKSNKNRLVDMSPRLAVAIKDHVSRRVIRSPLLFPSVNGYHIDAKNWRFRHWYPLLDHAKLTRRPPHQLRHTYATRLIQDAIRNGQGDSILVYLKTQLGHSSIQVTIDNYAHLIPGEGSRAVDHAETKTARRESSPSRQSSEPAASA